MNAHSFILRCLIIIISLKLAAADDSQCTINGRKAAHIVDERFISISLDPAFLFSGIRISSGAANLAKNIAPAFIRFAGPSTPFLKFGDDSKSVSRITEGSKSLVFGPTMWWSLNAWIKNTNLTPVFALNGNDEGQGNWDPKSSLSLLDLTAKMNVECYWQLGYDCDEKSEERYLEDLKSLRHILDAFPAMKNNWKTVGSDLSSCLGSTVTEIPRKFMEDLEGADAVMWEPENEADDVFTEDPMHRFLSFYQPSTPVWTAAPKVEHPVTFKDGLNWAIRLGETARNGFDVIFRQPRFQELFSDTPVYWVSYLHKRLMGRNVLDVKISSLSTSDTYIYAHCSKNQNSYSIRGAMTIMIINNGSTDHTTAMKVAGSQLKNVDVRSYILSSERTNSVDTFLNEEKLSVSNLTDSPVNLTPKLRRAKAITHLTLSVPPKSIGFFVLPGARIPICIVDEDETNLILEEMHRDQNIDFGDIFSGEILSRMNTKKEANSLSDLYHMIEKELEQDERFYKKIKKTPFINTDDWRKSLSETVKLQKNILEERKPLISESNVKKLLDKTKDIKFDIMKVDFKNLLAPVDMERRNNDDKLKPRLDVDMSSAEILKLLADRAKAKVEKKVGLANTDFDEIFEKAFKNKIRSRREARGGGRGRGSGRGGADKKKQQKRDINMGLLNEKAGKGKNSLFRGVQKEATIRKLGQSSDELLEPAFEPVKTEAVPTKIFAGLAAQEDEILAPPGLPMRAEKETIFTNAFAGFPSLSKKDLFGMDVNGGLTKIGLPALFASKSASTSSRPVSKKTYVGYVKDDDPNEGLDDLDNLGDSLDGYHGFHETFGGDVTVAKPRKLEGNRELWEFGGVGAANGNADDDLLQKEFIINNAETKEQIEKTIQRLENYFNNPTDKTINTDQDFESTFGRFKRELPTLELGERILDNIDDFKSRLERRQRSEKFRAMHRGRNIDAPRGNLFTDKKVKGRNSIPDSGGLDEKKYEHQIKFLKSRLAHRKKLGEHGFSKQLHPGDLQRKLKEHFELGTNRLRRVRSAENTYDTRYDEVYTPKVSMPQIRAYESKLGRIEEWKPEDILKLPKKQNPGDLTRTGGKEIRVLGNSLREINKRLPRHVNGDINSVENTIDEFLNAIRKDTKFIKPLSGEESGEYAIILPTRDSISLTRKNGDTELKIHAENKVKEQDVVDGYTCLASDFSTDPSSRSPDAITINDDPESTTLSSDNDVRFNATHINVNSTGPQLNSTSILTNSVDYVFSINKIMSSMNHLFSDLYKKIKVIFV